MSYCDDCSLDKFKQSLSGRHLQNAAAKAPYALGNASEDDDQPPIGNTRGTNSVIGSDNDEEFTGQMTQSGKHQQPAETIPRPAFEEPPLKRRRGLPPNANKPPKAATSRGRGRGRARGRGPKAT